jgi:hypothetical protein
VTARQTPSSALRRHLRLPEAATGQRRQTPKLAADASVNTCMHLFTVPALKKRKEFSCNSKQRLKMQTWI